MCSFLGAAVVLFAMAGQHPGNKRHIYLLAFFAVAGIYVLAFPPKEKPESSSIYHDESQAPAKDIDVSPTVHFLLSEGTGHDWLQASTRRRLELCSEIEETIGGHGMIEYRNFIFEFYSKANRENKALLDKPISEVASIGAALDFQD